MQKVEVIVTVTKLRSAAAPAAPAACGPRPQVRTKSLFSKEMLLPTSSHKNMLGSAHSRQDHKLYMESGKQGSKETQQSTCEIATASARTYEMASVCISRERLHRHESTRGSREAPLSEVLFGPWPIERHSSRSAF